MSKISDKHGIIGTINVRNATLRNACINTDCEWHTCHSKGLYENGCYMLKDNSKCCNGTKSGFKPYKAESEESEWIQEQK